MAIGQSAPPAADENNTPWRHANPPTHPWGAELLKRNLWGGGGLLGPERGAAWRGQNGSSLLSTVGSHRASEHPPPSLYEVPTYSTKAEAAPRAPGGARHGGRNGYLVKLSTKRGKTE